MMERLIITNITHEISQTFCASDHERRGTGAGGPPSMDGSSDSSGGLSPTPGPLPGIPKSGQGMDPAQATLNGIGLDLLGVGSLTPSIRLWAPPVGRGLRAPGQTVHPRDLAARKNVGSTRPTIAAAWPSAEPRARRPASRCCRGRAEGSVAEERPGRADTHEDAPGHEQVA
jgi:hypothetical protein